MKLTRDRLWWLKSFPRYGWGMGRPMLSGFKKWEAHSEALIKMGFLERDPEYPTALRVTEAGRAAIDQNGDST